MRSRKGIGKLKALLIIDLILVALFAVGYSYIASLPSPPLDSSQIQYTHLTLSHGQIQFGQTLQVTVNLTSLANRAGTYTVNLEINDDQVQNKTIHLAAWDTKTVEFFVNNLLEGVNLIKVGNLEETITVQSSIVFSDLSVNRTRADVGEPIGISIRVTNRGNEEASFSTTLNINGSSVETKTTTLQIEESKTLLFEVIETLEGTYNFQIGSLNGTFTITSMAPPAKPAEFEITQLTLNPPVADLGEPVKILVTVSNIGETSGEHKIDLKINNIQRDSKTVTLGGGETRVVEFTLIENDSGTYSVTVDSLTSELVIQEPSPITFSSLSVRPYEIWVDQSTNIRVTATNPEQEQSTTSVTLSVNDEIVESKLVTLSGGESTPVEFSFVAQNLGSHSVKVNDLTGAFRVVETGYHTLGIGSSPRVGVEFTLDGENHKTFYSKLLPVGTYTINATQGFQSGALYFNFSRWEDGSIDLKRTIELTSQTSITATYFQTACCPSLYIWNGTAYDYRAEVSDGTGYLGILDYFTEDGEMVFAYSDPWDYIKIESDKIHPNEDGYYDFKLLQNWDEIFYIDSAKLVVVDHSTDVNVFSNKGSYIYDLDNLGHIYTVSKNLSAPISAYTGNGQDVLDIISSYDGVMTMGNEFQWDTLILDLGDLSEAEEIKLIIAGKTIYSPGEEQGAWAQKFVSQPEVRPFPPPYMEVKDVDGNWIPVPDHRQMSLLDVDADKFVVDLTGLFLTDDYSLRINTFFDQRFDFIGIDTTVQQDLVVQEIKPFKAELTQAFSTISTSSGAFTRYGDVTDLIKHPNDKLIIGRQGDQINVLFSTENIEPIPENMERSYFIFISCWFKVNGLPYVPFTVDPLPFHDMCCFPYSSNENHPQSPEYLNYLKEYNTRIISSPT